MTSQNTAVRDPWAQDPWRVRGNEGNNIGVGSSASATTTASVTPVWPPLNASSSALSPAPRQEENSKYSLDAPSWDGKNPEVHIEPYLKSLRGWLLTTRTPKQQQGLLLLSSAKDDLKLIINELSLDDLTQPDGGERVYQLINNTFDWALKRTLPRKLEACLYGSSGERQRAEGFLAYTARKLQQYRELEQSGLALPSQVKGYIMAKHGKLTNAQWETMTTWTAGSLEMSTVSEALRRLDRPTGAGSAQRDSAAIVLFQNAAEGEWCDDQVLALDSMDEDDGLWDWSLQTYHMKNVSAEQLTWDCGDEQIVYVPAHMAEATELTEDQAVAIYANYQQIRSQLHSNTLGRGYYDQGSAGKANKGYNKGYGPRDAQKGKKGYGKGKYASQAYPFRTRLSELISRTRCARCGEKGHWVRSCTQGPAPRNNTQNTFWIEDSGPAFVAYLRKDDNHVEDSDDCAIQKNDNHVEDSDDCAYNLSADFLDACANQNDDHNVDFLDVRAKQNDDHNVDFLDVRAKQNDANCVEYYNVEFLDVRAKQNDANRVEYSDAYDSNMCFPILDKFIGLQMTSNLALIDTGAESGVMGSKARERLVNELTKRGLSTQRVNAERTSASGVGGKVVVDEVVRFPIGIAGFSGVLKAAVLQDPEVPVLLPVNMLLRLGAVLDLPARTIHWTKLGPEAVQSVQILASGHMAVDILDFSREQAMPGSHVFNSYDSSKHSVYEAAMRELSREMPGAPTGQYAGQHYWQESGITVLEARLTNELRKNLTAQPRRVLPLADNNRPQVQNEAQNATTPVVAWSSNKGRCVFTNAGHILIPNEDTPWKRIAGSDVHSHSTLRTTWRNLLRPIGLSWTDLAGAVETCKSF
eukprot:3977026-Amphidinium_carterae.1